MRSIFTYNISCDTKIEKYLSIAFIFDRSNVDKIYSVEFVGEDKKLSLPKTQYGIVIQSSIIFNERWYKKDTATHLMIFKSLEKMLKENRSVDMIDHIEEYSSLIARIVTHKGVVFSLHIKFDRIDSFLKDLMKQGFDFAMQKSESFIQKTLNCPFYVDDSYVVNNEIDYTTVEIS